MKKSMNSFLRDGRKKIDKDDILNICDLASKVFSEQKNLIKIERIPEKGVCIIGDIHGQFDDLVHILNFHGTGTYVFLGDYVDRGHESLRVSLLIFSLMIERPEEYQIFCLRGNHETGNMAKTFGLLDECKNLYGEDDGEVVFREMINVFRMMPIACLVDKKYFCVHGGLGPNLMKYDLLDELEKFDRKFTFLVEFNEENMKILENYYDHDPIDIIDLLWSDPHRDPSFDGDFEDNTIRGLGYLFGKEVTKKFCEKHSLEMIIRSHENVSHGYHLTHDEKLLTIFSASNYNYRAGNMGAMAILLQDGSVKIESYMKTKPLKEYYQKMFSPQVKGKVDRNKMGHLEFMVTQMYCNDDDKSMKEAFLEFMKDSYNSGLTMVGENEKEEEEEGESDDETNW